MRSTADRKVLMLGGVLVIVLALVWIARDVQGRLAVPAGLTPAQMQEPSYNAALLPRLTPGQILTFANGENREALLSGWSAPEPKGAWSAAPIAYLGFVVNGANAKRAIMRAMVWLEVRKLNEQHLQVWSAGKKLAEYTLQDPDAELTIPLGDIASGKDTPLILGLYLPDAKPANQIVATTDARMLGLFLESFQLAP